ncbi:MAG: enoyl-CoA hydratase/isomerase family protein [Dehalococcoidia bacterium]
MTSDVVLLERPRPHVAVVTINRPEKRNAVNREAVRRLAEAWFTIKDDADIWVAVLTGAGDAAFCSGHDLGELGRTLPEDGWRPPLRGADAFALAALRGVDLAIPVIAAVNGYCLGAGFALALACDLRIGATNASFGCTEVRYARMAGAQAAHLAHLLPPGPALHLTLTGDAIDADTAHRWGLISQVTQRGAALEEALALAERMVTAGPTLLRETKAFMRRAAQLSREEANALEALYSERISRAPEYIAQERAIAARGGGTPT